MSRQTRAHAWDSTTPTYMRSGSQTVGQVFRRRVSRLLVGVDDLCGCWFWQRRGSWWGEQRIRAGHSLLLQRLRGGTDKLAGHCPSDTHTHTHLIIFYSTSTHSLTGEKNQEPVRSRRWVGTFLSFVLFFPLLKMGIVFPTHRCL